jgi:hypothetical protein
MDAAISETAIFGCPSTQQPSLHEQLPNPFERITQQQYIPLDNFKECAMLTPVQNCASDPSEAFLFLRGLFP